MTTLLIDAGNSRIKLGWRLDKDYRELPSPREAGYAAFGHERLASELPRWLRAGQLRPRRAVGTNVAGARVGALLAGLLAQAGCPAVDWIVPGPRLLDVVNGYRDPARLGADRWLGLAGVRAMWRRGAAPHAHAPVQVLAHFGTATTIDTLDAAGRFIGGLILPGPALMRRSLASGTAQLPEADGRIAPFPDNTFDAIASGVAAAQAGAVARQWLAARQRHGAEPVLLASGGAWPEIAGEVEQMLRSSGSTRPVQVVDNPVLDGLACLVESQAATLSIRPLS